MLFRSASSALGQLAGYALRPTPSAQAATTIAAATPASAATAPIPNAPNISTSALGSLLSPGTDPGYSSPVTGSSKYDSNVSPTWNQNTLRLADAMGVSSA